MFSLHLQLPSDERIITLHRRQPAINKDDVLNINRWTHLKILMDMDSVRNGRHNWSRHAIARMQEIVYSNTNELVEMSTPVSVYLKISRDPSQMKKLEHEANIYCNQLVGIRGETVPLFYGFFVGDGADGQRLSCTVLELVHGDGPYFEGEIYRLHMLNACVLHSSGVRHNQLLEERHAIYAGDDGVRIVDFTEAELHDCAETYPELENDKFSKLIMRRKPQGCGELESLEAWCSAKSESLKPMRAEKLTDRKAIRQAYDTSCFF